MDSLKGRPIGMYIQMLVGGISRKVVRGELKQVSCAEGPHPFYIVHA